MGKYIDSAIDYQAEVFRQMIRAGIFVEGDPYIMAIHFYSPIFLLLHKVDHLPEIEEEALEILKNMLFILERCIVYEMMLI
jgi:hypothetical protein